MRSRGRGTRHYARAHACGIRVCYYYPFSTFVPQHPFYPLFSPLSTRLFYHTISGSVFFRNNVSRILIARRTFVGRFTLCCCFLFLFFFRSDRESCAAYSAYRCFIRKRASKRIQRILRDIGPMGFLEQRFERPLLNLSRLFSPSLLFFFPPSSLFFFFGTRIFIHLFYLAPFARVHASRILKRTHTFADCLPFFFSNLSTS